MGKASSNKKIARAQRAGGRSSHAKERSLLFPMSVAAVVILGVALIVAAKAGQDTAAADVPPRVGVPEDHWHAAYGISNCGTFEPPIINENDPDGIHTHGDGVIHIHPFTSAAAGEDARLRVFLDTVDLEVSDDEIKIPGGPTLKEGETKCDGKAAQIRVARWASADAAATTKPTIFTEDFGKIRFLADRQAITIFFGPADADIPPPPTIPALDTLTDVDPATTPTEVPLDPNDPATATTDPAAADPETTDSTAPETTDSTAPTTTATTAAP